MTQRFDRVEYDIRVSSLPTVFGEKIVMRLASKSALTRDKKDLGFPEEELRRFEALVKNPHGIILVTGPTGSGKSTTLYTVLSELNSGDVNIITVEDPVEADVDGINQVQVNEKAGTDLCFGTSFYSPSGPGHYHDRRDPRRGDSGNCGKGCYYRTLGSVGTLHTNSAASTITRMEDMEMNRI